MRIILSGGGTAGHINPAIAIADKLRERMPDCEIVFVGTKNGMENKLVPLASYPIWQLDTVGLKRNLSVSNIGALIKNLRAQSRAREILERFRPDAVIGTGGYVCYPIVKAASKMGIFTALHESNAYPGLAVRMLRKHVDKVFVSFDCCINALGIKEKCVLSGNPVKTQIDKIGRDEARESLGVSGKYRYVIVSFGGSLGAETVNKIALNTMKEISSRRSDVLHIHSCGKNGSGGFFEKFSDNGFAVCKNIRASEYIYNMPTCLKAADVVICRSGAMTLSEIAAAGVASILVPSPNVTSDHQYKNAMEFVQAGASFVVDERKDEVEEKSLSYVKTLLSDKALRESMAKSSLGFARPMAADVIADQIINRG